MTNFKLYFKINGGWQEISRTNYAYSGIPVFPFNYGEMLDERLNEAYVNIRKCKVSNFPPNTEMKIEVIENAGTENSTTTAFYFIVARDNAIERPIGSGLYRHEIYLIERTKKLEGIICQSITFTNPKGNIYTENQTLVKSENTITDGDIVANYIPQITYPDYVNPLPVGDVFSTASLSWMVDIVKDSLERQGIIFDGVIYSKPNRVVITNGGQTEEYLANGDLSKNYVVSAGQGTIKIEYDFYAKAYIDGVVENFHAHIVFVMAVVENRYPLRPYTIADCVDRCLLLAEPRFGNELPRYFLDPTQREKYEKIYAPQFSMTQCTLREQLKVIGGYIHAEPRLTEDDLIHFDELGEGEEWTPNEPYVFNQQSQDINEYCTQVDTAASNIINTLDYAQGVIFSPNRSDYLTIRTDSTFARVNEENGFAFTQFQIYDVVKVECGIFKNGLHENGIDIGPYNITPYVFEATEYHANLKTNDGRYPNSKSYAVYFARGEKNIRGLFFKEDSAVAPSLEYFSIVNILSEVSGISASDIRNKLGGQDTTYAGNLFFRISYIPYYSTRFSHGKPYLDGIKDDFSKIYNQSENLIETRYYGENIKGAAARLGNIEQSRTYRFSSLASVPRVGQTLGEYAISAVSVEVTPSSKNGVKVTVALSKDFNRISQYVGIQSRKRTYEVSEAEAYQRNVLLREYCVVGKKASFEKGVFRDVHALQATFNTNRRIPYTAVSACRDSEQSSVLLPVISSAFGNVMTFSWSYKDNYSAGDQVVFERGANNVSGFFQNDVPYCDYYGRINKYFFHIVESHHVMTEQLRGIARELPSSDYINGASDGETNADVLGGYQMMKDSREVINITLSVEFKTNMNTLVVGSALPANCPLVRDRRDQNGDINNNFVPKIYPLLNKVGKFQSKNLEASVGTELQSGTDGGTAYVDIPQAFSNVTAWAICLPRVSEQKTYDNNGTPETVVETNGGDILIACNDPAKFWSEADVGEGNTRRIYLNVARTVYN